MDLIDKYGLVSPMVMIRQSKLSLLARLAAKRPKCIVDLLGTIWDRDCGWVYAVRKDRAWFSCSGFFSSPLFADAPFVFDTISASPSVFVRAVRRYASSRFANFDVRAPIPSVAPPLFLNSTSSVSILF